MKRSRPQHLPFLQSFEHWNRFAAEHTAMLWAAGEVIGRRTTTMATHGIAPNAQERREMERMVEEKQSAMLEGSLAAWHEWMRLAQASWLDAVKLTMRNGLAFTPLMTNFNPLTTLSHTRRFARVATARSMASATRQWTTPLDTQLKIVDAAFGPTRQRVAANRRRLAA